MIDVEVKDPGGLINHVAVSHESPGVVVLTGDMTWRGKRAEALAFGVYGGRKPVEVKVLLIPAGGSDPSEIVVRNLPAEVSWYARAEVARYTLTVVLLSRDVYDRSRGRLVYELPDAMRKDEDA